MSGPTLQTFLDLQNEVLNYGFNDGPQVYRSRIKQWLNEAEFQIARQVEGPEFQQNATIQLVVNQYIYPLPSGFARTQDISYPLMNMRLEPVDIQDFDMTSVTYVSGPPQKYSLDQGNLLLFPNPVTADQLIMRYIAVPTPMVNDTDTPTLTNNYLHLLVGYAIRKAFEAEDDYEAAQYFEAQYIKDLANYASDVQWREIDRPRQVDGTWSSGSGGGGMGGW